MKKLYILIPIFSVLVIAFLFSVMLKEKPLKGEDLLGKQVDETCVSLVKSNAELSQEDAIKAQDCLAMMIAEIHSDGYKIGDQEVNVNEAIKKKNIVKYYKQKVNDKKLDKVKKLIKKASEEEVGLTKKDVISDANDIIKIK